MLRDEGYMKFHAEWKKSLAFEESLFPDLIAYRQKLYKLGYIGVYPGGIGFGNISLRKKDSTQFFITGSATGEITKLDATHISLVKDFMPEKNTLLCEGPVIASSESMSHGVIYRDLPSVNAVIHIHNLEAWKKMKDRYPTTPAEISYGTPEMAAAISTLIKTTTLPQEQLFIMAGHEEGIFSFGANFGEAFQILISAIEKLD